MVNISQNDESLYKLDYALTDGRLVSPSDGKHYDWKFIFSEVKRLKRPLFKNEMDKFLLSNNVHYHKK